MRLQIRASGRYLDNSNLHHHNSGHPRTSPALAISRAAELRARVCRGAVSARRHLHRHGGRGLHVLLPRRLHGRHVSGGRGRVRDQQPVREGELLQHGEIRNYAITSHHISPSHLLICTSPGPTLPLSGQIFTLLETPQLNLCVRSQMPIARPWIFCNATFSRSPSRNQFSRISIFSDHEASTEHGRRLWWWRQCFM